MINLIDTTTETESPAFTVKEHQAKRWRTSGLNSTQCYERQKGMGIKYRKLETNMIKGLSSMKAKIEAPWSKVPAEAQWLTIGLLLFRLGI